jgi:hypothetical protein
MAENSPRWDAYARLQTRLARRNVIDAYTWGLEAGLDRLLNAAAHEADVEKAVRSESRKERNRAVLRRAEFPSREAITETDEAGAVDARQSLQRIRRSVAPRDWALLRGLGEGYDYRELAVLLGPAPGALRARALRLRRALRASAAVGLLR